MMSSINVIGVGLSTIILVFVINLISQIVKKSKGLSSHLPGNIGWPIIGETLAFISNPKKFVLDGMSKHSSEIFSASLAGEKMVVFCGPKANRFIFSNEGSLFRLWLPASAMVALCKPKLNFESKTGTGKSIDDSVYKFLQVNSIQQYVSIVDVMVQDHLHARWDSKDTVKVHPLAKELLLATCLRVALNLSSDPNTDDFKKFSEPFLHSLEGLISAPINFPGTAYHKAVSGSKLFMKRIVELIDQRRMTISQKQGEEDGGHQGLLSGIIMDDQVLSNEEIAWKVIGFFFAAFYPTISTLTFVIAYLAGHPHIYDRVLREQQVIAKSKKSGEALTWTDIQQMKYSWNVICETMRLVAPVPGDFRETMADFTYAGFNIRKGSKVLWSPYSTHYDPKYFDDPEKFDPTRFEKSVPTSFTYVPFGGGPRKCPGKEYVKILTMCFLYRVVTNFKFKRVNPNEKIIFKMDIIPTEGLPVYLYPHAK